MSQQQVLDIAREALFLIVQCSAPMLIVSLVIGLIVSLFQTITSIQEQTLTFIPKIIGVFVIIMIFASWICTKLIEFMNSLWSAFGTYAGF